MESVTQGRGGVSEQKKELKKIFLIKDLKVDLR